MRSLLRSVLLVCGAAGVAVVGWAALAPIGTRSGADREELFEIPRGTWARTGPRW